MHEDRPIHLPDIDDAEWPHDGVPPVGDTPSAAPRRRPRWFILTAIALAAIVVLAGLAWVLLAARSPSGPTPAWQAAGLQGRLIHAVALGPDGGPAFAAAHGGIYHRDRAGAWPRVLQSVEVWDVVSLGPLTVAAENSGTVAVSADQGAHWRRSMVAPGGVYAVSIQPGHPQHLLAGADSGLYLSADGGLHWRRTLSLHDGAGDAFAWAPGSTSTVYAGTVSSGPVAGQQVYISHDAGRTWRVFGHGLQSTGGVMSVLQTSGDRIYAGTMGNAAWSASLSAPSWRKAATGMPPTGDHVAGMTRIPGTPPHVLAGTLGHGLFLTVQGSERWRDVSGSLRGAIVLAVAYSPHTRTVYASTSKGIFSISRKALTAPGR